VENDRFKCRGWFKRAEIMCDIDKDSLFECRKTHMITLDCIPIFMYCTGLTDVDDQLIYDGDVLKRQEFSIESDIKVYMEEFEVVWDSDRYFLRSRKGCWEDFSSNLSNNHFKIIGNIYENPELLMKNNESKGGQNETK